MGYTCLEIIKLGKYLSICLIVHFITDIIAENSFHCFLKFQCMRRSPIRKFPKLKNDPDFEIA